MEQYFEYYSKPKRIVSDQGKCFASNEFKEFCRGLNIEHVLIATGSPQSNGQVERLNRTLKPILAKLTADEDDRINSATDWDLVLKKAKFAINNTLCRATGYTPSILLFGESQRSEDCLGEVLRDCLERVDLKNVREHAAETNQKSQLVNKQTFDRKRKKATEYNKGDWVMVRNVNVTPKTSKKLIPIYKGPYIVDKIFDKYRLVIRDFAGFQTTQIPHDGIVPIFNVKPWLRTV